MYSTILKKMRPFQNHRFTGSMTDLTAAAVFGLAASGIAALRRERAWGKGLLLAMVVSDPQIAAGILGQSLRLGLFVNLTQGNVIRIFPALNIRKEEAEAGLDLLKKAITVVAAEQAKAG